MNQYFEKYTMGIIMSIAMLFIEEVGLPSEISAWKKIIVSLLFLPAVWYVVVRVNDNYETNIDAPYFTWKKFTLNLSIFLGFITTWVAALLLGYIE